MESGFSLEALDEYLLTRYHKEKRDAWAEWATQDAENLKAIWQKYRDGQEPVPRMAAWVLDKV